MRDMKRMALLSTMVKAVAEVEGLDETHVGWIARHLREAGLIAQAGRGRGAARMSANDAANLLIAVNASTSAKDAVRTANIFSNTRLNGDSVSKSSRLADRNKSFFSRIRTSNQQGVRLNDFLANLIRALQIGHNSKLSEDESIKIIIKFSRPQTKCNIQIYEANDAGALTLISDATFRSFDESDDTLSEAELISKYDNGDAFVPDRIDETIITRRTLSAVGEILTG
jgi:hypothetical protein